MIRADKPGPGASVLVVIACIAFLGPTSASAQVNPFDPENTGLASNYRDYFTAQYRRESKRYLALVEEFHIGDQMLKAYRAGIYSGPLADCKYALERFPNHPRALHIMGEIAKATNQIDVPIPYFEKALKLYPQYGYTHAQYGRYLVDVGAASVGIAEFKEALRLDPDLFVAQVWLAQAQRQVKRAGSP